MAGSIKIENLSFRFTKEDPVFSHVSFNLDQGEVFCLLGPNGSGKSTLLKCIAQLLPPLTGKVLLDTEKLGIAHLAQRPCNRLSGGEWQKVLIARALTQTLLEDTYGTPICIIRVGNGVNRQICVPLLKKHTPQGETKKDNEWKN